MATPTSKHENLKAASTMDSQIKPMHNADEALLARLGYRQEFRRNFSPFEVFGVGFSIIGLVPSIASVLVYSIPNGGPVAMVWGWATCTFFLMCIALSFAELGSAAPTSGGIYYWTYMFSTPKWRCFLSWIVGYANTIGNIAAFASVDWGCAVQIMAAASIGSGLNFSPTVSHTFAVYVLLLGCHVAICSLNTSVIARLQILFITLNVLLCFALIIGLPAATPSQFRNSAAFAFGHYENLTGWSNGFTFILSFLTPLWTIAAFDATVHISEEATNANVAIPFAIIVGTTSSCLLGWGIIVAISFCIGKDLQGVLQSPIQQPFATILFNSFGQRGALAIWSFIIVAQFAMATSSLTATSRQIFAFSRDGGLPLSSWLYYISGRSHSPVRCVWFAGVAALLLGVLAFAGASTINAIFTTPVVAQYLAYSIPISARFLGGKKLTPGPFSLGKFSFPIVFTAVAFMTFMNIVFLFPAIPHPTGTSMNYTAVVFGGTIALSVLYFYFPVYGGMYWFNGPVSTIKDYTLNAGPSDDIQGGYDSEKIAPDN